MNTNCDISKQKTFNEKGGQTDDRTSEKVNRYVSPHYRGSTKTVNLHFQSLKDSIRQFHALYKNNI